MSLWWDAAGYGWQSCAFHATEWQLEDPGAGGGQGKQCRVKGRDLVNCCAVSVPRLSCTVLWVLLLEADVGSVRGGAVRCPGSPSRGSCVFVRRPTLLPAALRRRGCGEGGCEGIGNAGEVRLPGARGESRSCAGMDVRKALCFGWGITGGLKV